MHKRHVWTFKKLNHPDTDISFQCQLRIHTQHSTPPKSVKKAAQVVGVKIVMNVKVHHSQVSRAFVKKLQLLFKRRKLSWSEHVLRHNSIPKSVLLGSFKGGRHRGRQAKCWMDNNKEWTKRKIAAR